MIAWSHSRLMDYEACPLMFHEKHIAKTVPFVTNKAIERGKLVHAGYERAAISMVHGSPVSPTELTAPAFPMLQAFQAAHEKLFIEEEWAWRQDLSVCSWFDKDAWLRVKIDLAGRVGPKSILQNEKYSVIDWKTGQYNVKEESLSQLRLSNIAVLMRNLNADVAESVFVFVDQKKTSPIIRTTRAQMSATFDEFCERAEAIQISEERDLWPPKKNWKCKWCGVRTCKHHKG